MIKLRTKVKFEDKTITDVIYLPEEYNFSKQNPEFINLISNKVKESGFEKPDTVYADIHMEL